MMRSMIVSLNEKEIKLLIHKKFEESSQERIKLLGLEQSNEIEKRIFLQTIDINWKSHIQYLEQRKTSNRSQVLWTKRSFN